MSRRCALLLFGPAARGEAAPPGVDPDAYAHALAEDVADLLHDLVEVDTLVVASAARLELARAVVWPGTPVLEVAEPTPYAGLLAAAEAGYAEAAVVPADVPDLPQIVLAKLYKALARTPVAVAPAENGGLVALAATLPPPDWLAGLDLDTALPAVRGAAPDRRVLAVTLGWRRLRTPADVGGLDPGLEGWEATRALLSGD